jgi:hypothetical protein
MLTLSLTQDSLQKPKPVSINQKPLPLHPLELTRPVEKMLTKQREKWSENQGHFVCNFLFFLFFYLVCCGNCCCFLTGKHCTGGQIALN